MVGIRFIGKASLAALLATSLVAGAAGQGVAEFAPVTDAEIQQPDPADWLSWRRTLDSWGYSPLDQIHRGNVEQLRLVWARPLSGGHQEGTPLVHDGVMYFPAPGDVIEAIDAKSGELLWQYRRDIPEDIGDYLPVWDTNRNIAIYGDLIIANGADDYLYALDVRTGELAWETQIMDYRAGAKQSAGPIIADGLAITGRSCEPEGGPDACVITAHDAKTGEEVWRTSTIARGDDPNDASWGGVPLEKRLQVGAWMVASYDPELKLVYMGTSVTAPAPKISLAGNDKEYLYHNSTLALDVKTGRIVWHYQHLVDHWDLDHPFPRMLIDQQVAPDPSEVSWLNPNIRPGRTYRTLSGVPGKTGVVYTLDRETGEFLWARPTVYQNVVGDIDGATGKVSNNPATVFTAYGEPLTVCPSASGGANYQAPAYSPLTRTMYFPAQNTCAEMSAIAPTEGAGIYGVAARQYLAPGAGDDLGVIHAVHAITGRTAWTYSQRAGMQSLMTTAGGLLFAGDAAGRFRALDQETGAVLWEINLGSSVTGYPATFAVGGQQYVAVSTGRWLNDTLTPELKHGTQNTLFVFALPWAGIGHRGPYRAPINPTGTLAAVDPVLQNAGAGPSRSVADGVFTLGQAEAGKEIYEARCAACHGVDFQSAAGTPTVRGEAFLAKWRGRTLHDLLTLLSTTMPPGAASAMSDQQHSAALAYILEANDFPAGEGELPADAEALRDIGFGS